MSSIRELDIVSSEYIRAIAELHKKAFPAFFLSQLGIPLLKTLYSCYIEDTESGIIVAEDCEIIVGFIAYSNDYPRFYKELIRNHLLKFAFCSLGAAMRHPSFIKRLFGAFKKSDSVTKNELYVELASICVDPQYKGRGIGSELIRYLKNMVDFNRFAYINLETDAVDNDLVNSFYKKNGFELARQYTTVQGRKMNEYRYRKMD